MMEKESQYNQNISDIKEKITNFESIRFDSRQP